MIDEEKNKNKINVRLITTESVMAVLRYPNSQEEEVEASELSSFSSYSRMKTLETYHLHFIHLNFPPLTSTNIFSRIVSITEPTKGGDE